MAYVYRHIRKDINQPFYIGVGLTDDNYKRANAKAKRSQYWKNITSLSDYEVQILFDDVSNEFALEKEKELISLYRRSVDGGTLCNLTLGGEGTLGLSPKNIRTVYAMSPNGEIFKFNSLYLAEKTTGCSSIGYLIKNRSKTLSGWYFSDSIDGLRKPPRKKMNGLHSGHRKNIVSLTDGVSVLTFKSYTEAAKYINVFPNHIGDLVRGKLKSAKGWKLASVD